MSDQALQHKNTKSDKPQVFQSNKSGPSQKLEEDLEKKLLEMKKKEEEEKYKKLAENTKLPYSDLISIPIDNEALSLISESESRASQLAVIYKKNSKVVVTILDPENQKTKETISKLEKTYQVEVILTNPHSFNELLKRYQTIKMADVFEIGAIEVQEKELDRLESEIKNTSDIKNKVKNISTTNLLEVLIAGALKTGSSDIHFEPESKDVRLRYRFDGLLHDIALLDEKSYEKILNRIKVLSKMRLNIHSIPQDGRITIRQKSVSIEVRVSVLPSEFGETVVMRLLDPRTIKKGLEELGMRDGLLKQVKEVLKKPTGAILTTGPTGSGKTTMLYSFVNYLNSADTKIITIEDPIEYHIDGISQTQVDSRKGYTFANGLRAIVRQDPDIILVGEIRDSETADIALQAALTGHLVLSTIHTNDSAGTVPRLVDLGIRTQIIAPAINMAMAQRLVRKLCPDCRIMKEAKPEILKKLKSALEPLASKLSEIENSKINNLKSNLKIGYPGKCKECNKSGYKGRVGVFEAFSMSREMERLILKSPPISDVRDLAIAEGMITMLQDAYLKIIDGVTSFEEIERILG